LIQFRRILRRYAGLLAVLGMLLLLLPLGLAQGAAPGWNQDTGPQTGAIDVVLDSVTVVAGQPFSTVLHVNNVPAVTTPPFGGLGYYTVKVTYDPAKLGFPLPTGSPPCGVTSLSTPFTGNMVVNCSAGAITASSSQITSQVGPSGNVSLLKYSGTAIGPVGATAVITITSQGIGDPNGHPFTVNQITNGTITIVAPPHISVSPNPLVQTLFLNQTAIQTLTVANTANIGASNLTWSVAESPAVGWLSEAPTSGTVASGGNQPVSVTFNSTGLAQGAYNTNLVITSNDPDGSPMSVPVTLQVSDQVVTIASEAVAQGGTKTESVTATGIDSPGLGGYQLKLLFDPAVVHVQGFVGGTSPFDTVLATNINNVVGFAVWNGLQTTVAPGPTGAILLSKVILQAVGPPNSCSPLNLEVIGLVDTNGQVIPSVAVAGPVCVRIPLVVTSWTSGVDQDGCAGARSALVKVVDPVTPQPSMPEVMLQAYNASQTYPSALLHVLDVRLKAPFGTGTVTIDNPNGSAQFNASAPGGALWPVDPLAFATLSLEGTVSDVVNTSLQFSALPDGNGFPLSAPGPMQRTYRRGDAKADGTLFISDALFIAQLNVGLRPPGDGPDQVNPVNAASIKHDAGCDKVTAADVLLLAQYLVGIRDGNFNLLSVAVPPAR